MSFRSKQVAKFAALFLIVFLVCSTLAIRVEQRSIEKRATALFNDLRELDLRSAPRAQALAAIRSAGVPFSEKGDCPQANCDLEVQLTNFAWRHSSLFGTHQWLLRSYELMRGRPVRIHGSVSIVGGIVWGKGFSLQIYVPPDRNEGGFFGAYGYGLIADFDSQSNFYVRASPQLLLHPNYVIGRPGGCEVCIEGWVYFTPYANPDDVRRLMQVNLSCISRWIPCRDQADVMPVPWAEYVTEEKRIDELYTQVQKCSPAYVALLGRDAWNVVVVEVINDRLEHRGRTSFHVVNARLVERLKRANEWDLGTVHQARLFNEELPISTAAKTIRSGMRLILAYDNDAQSESVISPAQCGVIPATKGNMAVVERAVTQDFRATFPNPERVPF